MAQISPFKALRPQPQLAQSVASRPYDVLSTAEAIEEARGNENSFLHITRSEIDLPPATDVYSPLVYQKAKENLEAFVRNGVLFREQTPYYYIYQLQMGSRRQAGLVAISSLDDYDKNTIKKHELTRPDKENDRINHMKITGAQTGNVFVAYRNVPAIDEIVTNWQTSRQPIYDFAAADGIQHTVWVIDDTATIEKITDLFKTKVAATYIADGHHRAASAAKVRKLFGKSTPADANFFLTTLFPANDLQILDYNRLVKSLNGLEEEELISYLHDFFDVTLMGREPYSPEALHDFGMYLNGKWYKLTAREDSYSTDPVGVLDVTILSDNVLDKFLGIRDQRTDKRIEFVGGIRGLKELQRRVDSGEMKVAFSLYPVSIAQLFAIADSGKTMPPKSTWFEPKLRDGLLTHLID